MRFSPPPSSREPITPAQIIIPIAFGLVVLALIKIAQYQPPLPEWTIANDIRDLDSEVHLVAAKQLQSLQPKSFARNLEYCGYIYRGENGIVAAPPVVGSEDGCTINFPDEGFERVVASYHSHAAYSEEYDNEAPSMADMTSTVADGVDDYIATPGGRLWYVSEELEAAMLICGEGCLQTDSKYIPCPGDDSATSYRLDDLEARDRARDIMC